jgi:hypothetical protein
MKWLMAKDTKQGDSLIIVKDFFEKKYVVLFDKSVLQNILVDYTTCVPWCLSCKTDDCGHIGFAICLKQYCDRNNDAVF